MLKAVIFDMDGVIIDSEPQHARATLRVFQNHGLDVDLNYCIGFIGTSIKKMAEETIATYQMTGVTVEQLQKEIDQAKRDVLLEEGYIPIPGVQALIHKLYKEGIHLAIASSSSVSEIDDVVKSLGIRKYFTKLISSAHVEHPKPAPDIFLLAAKELGINPKEAIIIEDSCFGVTAAYNAGICSVGFLNPNSGNQDLGLANVLLESFEGIDSDFFINTWKRAQGKPITIASTKRLLLRELSADDIKEMYSIYKDPKVQEFVPEIADYFEAERDKMLAYIRNVYAFYGYGLWGVFSKTTKGLIGRCGFENQMIDDKEEIMLSYLLDSQHWGYGYALECCNAALEYAWNELSLHRIVAVIDKRNSRSIHTAQKLNMILEKEIIHNGIDCYLYAITPK